MLSRQCFWRYLEPMKEKFVIRVYGSEATGSVSQ